MKRKMMIVALLACCIGWNVPVASAGADTEPNNSCTSPSSWPGGMSNTATGGLGNSDLNDYAQLEVLRGEEVTLEMDPVGVNYDLKLITPNCSPSSPVSANPTAGAPETISRHEAAYNGMYVSRAYSPVNPAPVSTYSIGYTIYHDDMESGTDAGNAAPWLTASSNGVFTASLGRTGDNEDWYEVVVPAGKVLTVTLADDCYDSPNYEPFDADLELYTTGGALRASSYQANCGANPNDVVSCGAILQTTVRFRVVNWNNGIGYGRGGYDVTTSAVTGTASPTC